MPRDGHPKLRQAAKLARKAGARPPHDRLLIVCEGEKTEPNYLNEIRREDRIASAHVSIVPSDYGTDPLNIVRFAEDRFRETKAFERVYAVFDRDDHLTYERAVRKAESLDRILKNDERRPVDFKAIVSVPCFELWFLLHYRDVHDFGHRTEIYRRLRERVAGYEKGHAAMYAMTKTHLDAAMQRATRLATRFGRLPGDVPYTDAHTLVATLRALAQ